MARIRTIKPEFFTSEDIVGLSPMARLLYIAIWCEADKEGRLLWKPLTFKLRYFPGDSCDIHAMCDELVEAGLVGLYGDGYAVIPSFKAHQHINPRESDSQLPEPTEIMTRASRVPTRQPRDEDAQGGREGKGRERKESNNAALAPHGVSDSVWADFLKVRKAKKAPMTNTALAGIIREAEKAGYTLEQALMTCCARGWQSFRADWVASTPVQTFSQVKADVAKVTVPENPDYEATQARLRAEASRPVAKPSEAILARLEALRGQPKTLQ